MNLAYYIGLLYNVAQHAHLLCCGIIFLIKLPGEHFLVVVCSMVLCPHFLGIGGIRFSSLSSSNLAGYALTNPQNRVDLDHALSISVILRNFYFVNIGKFIVPNMILRMQVKKSFKFGMISVMLSWFWSICCNIILTLLMLETIFRLLRSMPCLLRPWLLESPGHQQAWYWPQKQVSNIAFIMVHGLNEGHIIPDPQSRIFRLLRSIPCLLRPWRLKSPGHQQAWYWPPKLASAVSRIRRVKRWKVCVIEEERHIEIHPSHQSDNALDKHPTMHHVVTECYKTANNRIWNWCIVESVQ